MDKKAIYTSVRQKIDKLDKETPWNRAMLAKLRHAIGKHPGAIPDVLELILSDAPDEWRSTKAGEPSFEENAIHTSLTLYALHRQGKEYSMSISSEDGKNTGDSFGRAAARIIRKDEDRFESIKRRFNAAATSVNFTELAWHARGIIQLLKAEDIAMDYPGFASDIYEYQYPGRADAVRLRWGEDFYRTLGKKEDGKDEDKHEK